MNLTDKLDKLMRDNKLNRKSLSEKINIPYSTIIHLYNVGRKGANVYTIYKIARYFHVTIEYLIDDDIVEIDDSNRYEIQRLYDTAPERIKKAVDALLKEDY